MATSHHTIMNHWIIPFEAHGKNHEIRISFDGLTFRVRAFLDGQPANQFEYLFTLEKAQDLQTYTGIDAVEELIKVAQDHVQRKV
jgi:hypothetical protein